MLQNIRDNVQGTMAKVIVAIIIVPFAIFGVETLFSSNGPTPVAKVNGSKISELDLAQAISMQKRQMLACHKSQLQRGSDGDFAPLAALMQRQCETRGAQANVAAAEAFRWHHAFKRVGAF